ncbi:hypothetical protein [Rhizobium sp. BK376]|uniref:hypothetical protein n=1 Tax=Rhizobium sp. BK376 TaxID=2512149 RepID=UPI0010D68C62|nr:hypothetical protein [Rhizobium sp. BK376]TCR72222.1 hypothetical protein EV561_13047 [Rhizobium sp. BK376]
MTPTTNFVAELYRAANEIDRLTTVEKRRLLVRAAHTIVDMEELLGNVADHRSHRLATELLALSDMVLDGVWDVLISHGFLEAADAIRRLKILADSE